MKEEGKKEKMKKNKGITLIALIITIIVMLILVAVSVRLVINSNILLTAKNAGEKTKSEYKEESSTGTNNIKIDGMSWEQYFALNNQGKIEKTEDKTPGKLDGEGTETNPYKIESIEDLVVFSNMVNGTGYKLEDGIAVAITEKENFENKNVLLNCNLDFNSKESYVDYTRKDLGVSSELELLTALTTNKGFTPIGNSTDNSFAGTFDGNGKTINNIYINTTEKNVGLFGIVTGKVSNLTLLKGNISSTNMNVGSIVGNLGTGGIVDSCYNLNVNISSTLGQCGGIVAYSSGIISNCSNYGTITAPQRIAGVCGAVATDGQILNCNNYGSVTATGDYSAGVFAMTQSTAIIKNCNNYGTISGNSYVGGIGAYLKAGTLESCANEATITATSNYLRRSHRFC